MLFAATNAVAKSFLSESKGLQLYYYTLLAPRKVILAKTAYNSLLLICVGIINYICYSVLFETIISDRIQFFVGLVLGSIGLSATLTLVSGIASRANNSSALIAILGFPLLLPLLLVILQFSKNAIDGLDWSLNQSNFILLTSLDGIIIILSYLLFPYLWRD
jgi:heme exporter protein B